MAVVYKTSVPHFKVKNTPLKDTAGKRKFKIMEGRLFFTKLSLEEIEITKFSSRPIGTLGLF